MLIFDVTTTSAIGYAAGALTFAMLAALWLIVPLRLRRRARRVAVPPENG